MPRKRTLEEMAADLYDSQAVAKTVIADADRLGTREKIESGELVLPSPQDASHFHARILRAKVDAEIRRRMEEEG